MDAAFKKSSFSQYGDNHQPHCVEVRRTASGVCVRDSKNPNAATLTFTNQEWKAFLFGAQAGEFDLD
jgi:hypothetical protein